VKVGDVVEVRRMQQLGPDEWRPALVAEVQQEKFRVEFIATKDGPPTWLPKSQGGWMWKTE